MTRKLIGLGGKLRAGKDEVAKHLANTHDYVVMGMSDRLNEALLKLNPIIPTTLATPENYMRYQQLHDAVGYVEAKKNPEVRRLLQALGTEVGREMIDQDVWVNMAVRTIEQHWADGNNVVITAIRFPNELEMVRRLGGVLTWVDRPDEGRTPEGAQKGADEAQSAISGHASENSVSSEDFDYVLSNDGTLEELFEKVDEGLKNWSGFTPVMALRVLQAVIPKGRDTSLGWPAYDR